MSKSVKSDKKYSIFECFLAKICNFAILGKKKIFKLFFIFDQKWQILKFQEIFENLKKKKKI